MNARGPLAFSSMGTVPQELLQHGDGTPIAAPTRGRYPKSCSNTGTVPQELLQHGDGTPIAAKDANQRETKDKHDV